MRFVRFLAAILAFLAVPAAASSTGGNAPFGDAVAMDSHELAEERGGFILPGGIDLDLVVRQETSIDGQLVLRSSFALAEGAPVVSIEQVSQGVSVQTEGDDATTRVTVAVPGTQVSHLAGQATGSIITNTANNRTISTVTSVDLDLSRLEVGSIGSLIPTLGALARETASYGI
jgi:hypothetical protein